MTYYGVGKNASCGGEVFVSYKHEKVYIQRTVFLTFVVTQDFRHRNVIEMVVCSHYIGMNIRDQDESWFNMHVTTSGYIHYEND